MWSPYNTASGRALSGASGRIETPIIASAGMTNATGSVEQVPVFTGYIRSIDVDPVAGVATITALDGSDRMRSQCNVPQIIGNYLDATYFSGIVKQGLNGGRVIDYLLRANGKYLTPPPRSGCLLSVPTHGSLEPDYVVDASGSYVQYGTISYAWDGSTEVSSLGSTQVQYIADIGNDGRTGKPKMKFGQCPEPQQGISAQWNLKNTVNFNGGPTLSIETWVDLSNPLNVSSGAPLWSVNLPVAFNGVENGVEDLTVGFTGDRRPFINYGNTAGTPVYGTATATSAWIYALINIFSSTTSASAAFTLNSTAPTAANGRIIKTTVSYLSDGNTRVVSHAQVGSYNAALFNGPGTRARFEALQITTEASAAAIAATNLNFVPTAAIEPSLNALTLVPFNPDKQDSWAVAQEIAAAEFGTLFFDEKGLPTFWNRNHYRFASGAGGIVGAPVASVTSTRNLETLTSTEAVDSVVNHIALTATPYTVQTATWVYQLATHDTGIHSNSDRTYFCSFANAAATVSTTVSFMPLGGASGQSYYRACRTADGTGDPVSNLTFVVKPYSQHALVTVTNPNNYPVYLVCSTNDTAGNPFPSNNVGVPFLWLWGSPVTQAAASTISSAGASTVAGTGNDTSIDLYDQFSITKYGEQIYSVTNSIYLQNLDSLRSTAADMLDVLAYPYPVLSNVTISAIPGLQIGDRITLNDPAGALIADDFFIVGISSSFDPTAGYTQSLTLRSANGPNSFILDDAVRGALNSTYVLNGTF
jgi:hypothetical protein